MPIADENKLPLLPWYTFFENCPLPAQIFTRDGVLIAINRASMDFWGTTRETAGLGTYSLLTDPQALEKDARLHIERAMQGETIVTPRSSFNPARAGMTWLEKSMIWLESMLFPLTDETGAVNYLGAITRDVTREVEQERAIEAVQQEVNEQRADIEAARREIAEQRATIMELSSPVIKVWEGIVTMPLIGSIDARRATILTENLLEAIVQYQAESVIMDITGVAVVDTQVANYLLSAARACRLLGSKVALVGIGSEIAQTIVHLGLDLSDLVTRADLQAGLAWAFERQNLSVVATE